MGNEMTVIRVELGPKEYHYKTKDEVRIGTPVMVPKNRACKYPQIVRVVGIGRQGYSGRLKKALRVRVDLDV